MKTRKELFTIARAYANRYCTVEESDAYIQGFILGAQWTEKEIEAEYKEYQIRETWREMTRQIDDEYQPEIPIVSQTDYQKIIIPALIRCGAIPKENLKKGSVYKGYCRNANEAVWLGNKFEYDRYKFGDMFKEQINHFEDDNGLDLFIPYEEV